MRPGTRRSTALGRPPGCGRWLVRRRPSPGPPIPLLIRRSLIAHAGARLVAPSRLLAAAWPTTWLSSAHVRQRSPPSRAGFVFRSLEPTLGFEPRTCCLRNSCSTAELCRRGRESTSPIRSWSNLSLPRPASQLGSRPGRLGRRIQRWPSPRPRAPRRAGRRGGCARPRTGSASSAPQSVTDASGPAVRRSLLARTRDQALDRGRR